MYGGYSRIVISKDEWNTNQLDVAKQSILKTTDDLVCKYPLFDYIQITIEAKKFTVGSKER